MCGEIRLRWLYKPGNALVNIESGKCLDKKKTPSNQPVRLLLAQLQFFPTVSLYYFNSTCNLHNLGTITQLVYSDGNCPPVCLKKNRCDIIANYQREGDILMQYAPGDFAQIC